MPWLEIWRVYSYGVMIVSATVFIHEAYYHAGILAGRYQKPTIKKKVPVETRRDDEYGRPSIRCLQYVEDEVSTYDPTFNMVVFPLVNGVAWPFILFYKTGKQTFRAFMCMLMLPHKRAMREEAKTKKTIKASDDLKKSLADRASELPADDPHAQQLNRAVEDLEEINRIMNEELTK